MSSTAPALGEGAQIPLRAHMPSPSSFSPHPGLGPEVQGQIPCSTCCTQGGLTHTDRWGLPASGWA